MWPYVIAGLVTLVALATITTEVKSYLDEVKASGKTEAYGEWRASGEKRRALEAQWSATAAKGLQDDRSARKGNVKTVIQTVEKIIEKPIYHNVCFDPAGLQCANAALGDFREGSAGCKPGGTVPRANATLRWEWQLRVAEAH